MPKFHIKPSLLDMALVDAQVIFNGEPNSDSKQHFGSRLAFDNEGYLYITLGDRSERDINPQWRCTLVQVIYGL
jgi:glucose/arabinose dehydrogenase